MGIYWFFKIYLKVKICNLCGPISRKKTLQLLRYYNRVGQNNGYRRKNNKVQFIWVGNHLFF